MTVLPPGAQVVLQGGDRLRASDLVPRAEVSEAANKRVCLWRGDITALRIDAVVNAANESLAPGGGISGAIHAAAGPGLALECKTLGGAPTRCPVGQTVLTSGCGLPSKCVLHTVGPTDQDPRKLRSCYVSALNAAVLNGLRSVALCCISTGIYGFPLVNATHVALGSVRKWLDEHMEALDRVVFVAYSLREHDVYSQLMPNYFPRAGDLRLSQGSVSAAPSMDRDVRDDMDVEEWRPRAAAAPRQQDEDWWLSYSEVPSSASASASRAFGGRMGVEERPARFAPRSLHQGQDMQPSQTTWSTAASSAGRNLRDMVGRVLSPTLARGEHTCARPGCSKPTWNGKPGEFCCRQCRKSAL